MMPLEDFRAARHDLVGIALPDGYTLTPWQAIEDPVNAVSPWYRAAIWHAMPLAKGDGLVRTTITELDLERNPTLEARAGLSRNKLQSALMSLQNYVAHLEADGKPRSFG